MAHFNHFKHFCSTSSTTPNRTKNRLTKSRKLETLNKLHGPTDSKIVPLRQLVFTFWPDQYFLFLNSCKALDGASVNIFHYPVVAINFPDNAYIINYRNTLNQSLQAQAANRERFEGEI